MGLSFETVVGASSEGKWCLKRRVKHGFHGQSHDWYRRLLHQLRFSVGALLKVNRLSKLELCADCYLELIEIKADILSCNTAVKTTTAVNTCARHVESAILRW